MEFWVKGPGQVLFCIPIFQTGDRFLLLKILVQLFKHCCGTGMFISDSDFFSSWIPDPTSTKKIRGKKLVVLWVINFTKLEKFYIWTGTFQNCLAIEQKSQVFLICNPKNCYQALRNKGWGSGKNLSRIRIQGSKKHWIPDPDPECCF